LEIYVGIDVGAESHSIHMVDEQRRPVAEDLRITNDAEGFSTLRRKLLELEGRYGNCSFSIGMEATGHYWRNLFHFLNRSRQDPEPELGLDLRVSLLNPCSLKKFWELMLERVKTDRTDARSIAHYMAVMRPKPTTPRDKELEELRDLCRFRRGRIREQTRLKNRLHKGIMEVFPEYRGLFRDITCKSSLAVLKRYPTPEEILKAPLEELSSLSYGKRNHKLGREKASALKRAAERSVGAKGGEAVRYTLQCLAEDLERIGERIEGIEAKIVELYRKVEPNKLPTIPGINEVSAAVITTEIGDIARFPSAKELNGYVGIYPELRESGKQRSSRPRMTKKGNKYLRQTLFLCTLSAIYKNPLIRAHYERQRSQGKDKMVAVGSCMRKMVHLIYGILKTGREFDPEYEAKRSQRGKGR